MGQGFIIAPCARISICICWPVTPLLDAGAETQVTPVWRAGPSGPKTLCNACGVRYMKNAKKR